ncbi:MAG: LCP family protein [Oscillospiraceae bacterium]|nr:LCP family protein [Oscillospiraceae bacterium]
MAKKSAKVALAYFITLLIAFLVFGGLLYYLANHLLEPEKQTTPAQPNFAGGADEADGSYKPSKSDSQAILLIAETDKKQTSTSFILLKTLPVERGLVVTALPGDSYANVNGEENSIFEFYRTQGVLAAVKAAESAAGMTIDKYLKVNTESLSLLINVFGGIDFDIPYNLIHEVPGGNDIIIREGQTYLDADTLIKVITFPAYREGEQYRARITTMIAAELINKNVNAGFSGRIDSAFNLIINSDIETNITAYDYAEKADSLKYIAENQGDIAIPLVAMGEYNENGLFVFEPNFVQLLNHF